MQYRCEATTVEGFVQQIACCYFPHGYWFHVGGFVPEHKDPNAIDAKLVERYGLDLSRSARCRRKRQGHARLQYIRHGRFFVLLSSHGKHRFFEDEAKQIRDARRSPIRYAGYSLSHRGGHSHVRIEADEYRILKGMLLPLARKWSTESLFQFMRRLPYEPYAPVRRQLLRLWNAVNAERVRAHCEPVPIECVRLRRRIVRPFGVAGALPPSGTVTELPFET